MAAPSATGTFRLLSPPVVLETVDEETIAVNLDSGLYYDLNHSASHALRLLGEGASPPDVAGWLVARYGVDAASAAAVNDSVARLAAELVAEGILGEVDDSEAAAATVPESNPEPSRRPWAEPALGRHDDMQELLLLDPVHDVDAGGWPSRI